MLAAKPVEMNVIDRLSIGKYGIPGIVLMENAALKVVDEACRMLNGAEGRNIFIAAGKGNNGGDAFAAARHLFQKQAVVTVCLFCRPGEIKGDALINYEIVKKLEIPVILAEEASSFTEIENTIKQCNLIIDGLFGTGFKGEITGAAALFVQLVNRSSTRVISIDIPSGVNGETGKVADSSIKADATVTFGLPKTGLLVHPGCEYTGRLVIADIGLPAAAVAETDITTVLSDAVEIKKLIPARKSDSNKGTYGKVLIVAGSSGMAGAGCLAARACLRSGTGLVYLAGPSSLIPVFGAQVAEAVAISLEDEGVGALSMECLQILKEKMKMVDVAAVGPGLSVTSDTAVIVREILNMAACPLVLDADALNIISQDINILGGLKTEAVITPHPGEMARLMGTSIADIQNDRMGAAREFARRWKVTVVLKGSRSIIAAPDGRIFINGTGNSGMATAGAGDVLTGLIAGLLAQGMNTVDAARAGAYVHGLAGDLAAVEKGEHGMIASDVAEALPAAIKNLLSGNITDFFEKL